MASSLRGGQPTVDRSSCELHLSSDTPKLKGAEQSSAARSPVAQALSLDRLRAVQLPADTGTVDPSQILRCKRRWSISSSIMSFKNPPLSSNTKKSDADGAQELSWVALERVAVMGVLLRAAERTLEHYSNSGMLLHARATLKLYASCRVTGFVNYDNNYLLNHLQANLAVKYYELGSRLAARYEKYGNEAVANDAISALRAAYALQASMSDEYHQMKTMIALGDCLSLRYHFTSNDDDIRDSVSLLRSARAVGLTKGYNVASAVRTLAEALLRWIQGYRHAEDLDQCMEYLEAEVANQHAACIEHGLNLSTLALILDQCFRRSGNSKDLHRAVELQRAALDLLTSQYSYYIRTLDRLAKHVELLHDMEPHQGHLEEVHDVSQTILAKTSRGEVTRMVSASRIANYHRYKYIYAGTSSNLHQSIDLWRSLIQDCPIIRYQVRLLYNLAIALGSRNSLTGSENDLDESITLLRQAHEMSSPSTAEHSAMLVNLAMSLRLRYFYAGSPDDCQEALQLCSNVLQARYVGYTTIDTSNIGLALGTSASILVRDYQTTGDVRKLDKAIMHLHAAIPLVQEYNRSGCISNLGRCFRILYEMLQLLPDIQKAKEYAEKAVASGRSGTDPHNGVLLEYARTLSCYIRSSPPSPEHLALAARVFDECLDLCKPGHPMRFEVHLGLFHHRLNTVAQYFDRDVELAFFSLRDAVEDQHCSARSQLRDMAKALSMLPTAMLKPSHLDILSDIYRTTISLMPQVASLGFSLAEQVFATQGEQALIADGAVCAILCDKLGPAIEMVEEGRGLLWSQALRFRSAFDALPPPFSASFKQLARAIEAGLHAAQASGQPKLIREEQVRIRRQQQREMDDMMKQVRELPGFGRFLLPPTIEQLSLCASGGTVVLLIENKIACAALVITASNLIRKIDLPAVSADMLDELAEGLHATLAQLLRGRRRRGAVSNAEWKQLYTGTGQHATQTLKDMWYKVVKVILDALHLKHAQGRARPRLWWCPTGYFTFLPLHAAGLYDDNPNEADCCSNYVVSSYTPTLMSMVNGRKEFKPMHRTEIRALLAAVPEVTFTDDWPELSGTSEEVTALETIIPPKMVIPLPEGGVTMADIEDRISDASIVHLSCHGLQNTENALSSGFVMKDGMLTVDRLMKLSLPNAFLAFLSACEIAKGDKKQPDQVVHLAAAMLFTGFRSVVGTMWSIDEDDAVLVATEFYKYLLGGTEKDVMDPDDVAYALDEAITKLRKRDEHPGRWASHIHLGI